MNMEQAEGESSQKIKLGSGDDGNSSEIGTDGSWKEKFESSYSGSASGSYSSRTRTESKSKSSSNSFSRSLSPQTKINPDVDNTPQKVPDYNQNLKCDDDKEYSNANGWFVKSTRITGRSFHKCTRITPAISTCVTILVFFGLAFFFAFHALFSSPSQSYKKQTESQLQQQYLNNNPHHQNIKSETSNFLKDQEQTFPLAFQAVAKKAGEMSASQSQLKVQFNGTMGLSGSHSMNQIGIAQLIEAGLLDVGNEDLGQYNRNDEDDNDEMTHLNNFPTYNNMNNNNNDDNDHDSRNEPILFNKLENSSLLTDPENANDSSTDIDDETDETHGITLGNQCFIPSFSAESLISFTDDVQEPIKTCNERQLDENYEIKNARECCYQIIKADESINEKDQKDDLWKSLVCNPFDQHDKDALLNLENNFEFIRIQCRAFFQKNNQILNKLTYKFLANVPLKSQVVHDKIQHWIELHDRNLAKAKKSKSPPMNVLLLGLDSTSRANFHRNFPKSRSILKKLEFIDMKGFHIVGQKTLDNIIPLLMGVSRSKLRTLCNHRWKSYWDECPFIWKKFSNAHYVTLYAEDLPDSFNYGAQSGFEKKPTDFYLRPLLIQKNEIDGDSECFGNLSTSQFILNYVQTFMKKFQSFFTPFFGFTWLNIPKSAFSSSFNNNIRNTSTFQGHKKKYSDSSLFLQQLDDTLTTFFKTLSKDKNLLNSTLIILLSNHGIQTGPNRQNLRGYLDHRLPLLYIRPPVSNLNEFTLQKYPDIRKILELNSREITTAFDIHSTLESVVEDLDSVPISSLASEEQSTMHQNPGINLFTTNSQNRSCESAKIDFHWCTCRITESTIFSIIRQNNVIPITIKKLNDMMAIQKKSLLMTKPVKTSACPEIIFERILYAGSGQYKNREEYILLGIQVNPNHAQFEVFLTKEPERDSEKSFSMEEKKYVVNVPIIRIDRNSGYIFCVNH